MNPQYDDLVVLRNGLGLTSYKTIKPQVIGTHNLWGLLLYTLRRMQ